MARAWVLGVIGAAAAFGASVAMAGWAPVAYYPSLGYGQTPPPDVLSRAYAQPRRDGPPPQERTERHADAGESHRGERRERYESRNDFEAGYGSGWRPSTGAYAHGRDDRQADDRAMASISREQYDYDSGWRVRTHEDLGSREPAPARDTGRAYEIQRGYADDEERIPDSFFADAGGVGPDEFEWGGGGGGYVVGAASSEAFASASASAGARVNVGVRLGRHGGRRGGGPAPHGCGCRK